MSPAERKDAKRAHNILWHAIFTLGLKRGDVCEGCGTADNIDAHHDDYSKPLAVRWLCKSCHKLHHLGQPPREHKPQELRTSAFDPLVIEVARTHHVKPEALTKWRQRGVPNKFRFLTMRLAQQRGIPCPTFELRAA